MLPRGFFGVTRVTASAVTRKYGGISGPTDIGAVSAQERKAQAQTQADTSIITILLVCFNIFLAMLVLLFADLSLSKAAIELMSLF